VPTGRKEAQMKKYFGLAAMAMALILAAAACSSSSSGTGGGGTSSPMAITSWQQLGSGDKVGVQSGTTGEFWAKANLQPKGVTLVGYTKAPDIFNAVESGQLTAAVVDLPVATDIAKTKPDLSVVQQIATGEQYAFAVNKSNTSLLNAMNAAMKTLFADGTYATIFTKYFPTQEMPSYATPASAASPAASPTCPSLKTLTNGQLTIGSDIPYPPFEFNQQGKLTGFDVELMDAVAQQLCLKPVWVNSNFNTIFTSLAANKFDTVASAVTAYAPQGSPAYATTQQRAQIVAFSVPYYDSLQSLTVKKTTP
jgi:polar amino acid transport system substrate-binding protein